MFSFHNEGVRYYNKFFKRVCGCPKQWKIFIKFYMKGYLGKMNWIVPDIRKRSEINRLFICKRIQRIELNRVKKWGWLQGCFCSSQARKTPSNVINLLLLLLVSINFTVTKYIIFKLGVQSTVINW